MATTDAKPGFRLPWSAERTENEAGSATTREAPIGEAHTTDQEIETPDMIDAAPADTDQIAAVDEGSAVSEPTTEGDRVDPSPTSGSTDDATAAATTGRKPNKFMADLTRAMQGAAETAKADTLARFSADAKAHIETIHASTAVEATELRKQADDDVAAIREWSKAEIARIREETDERITDRKSRLEREIDAHAADIEARIERVQRRVDAFEAEMADFFQRLIAEDDATRFAAMAESMPEPSPFDDEPGSQTATPTATEGPAIGQVDDLPAERGIVLDPWPEAPAEAATAAVDETETVASLATGETPSAEASNDGWMASDDQPTGGMDVAIGSQDVAPQTETEAVADDAETEAVAGDAEAEAVADDAETEAVAGDAEAQVVATDPRLDALGLTPDFDAAEAEAATFSPEEAPSEEDIAVIGDDALAARLAGLVPDADSPAAETLSTRIVVTGLVSVASIAGFKRQLSRVAGVQSVGVSSGPDGEFFFAVAHDDGVVLRDAVTTLPGFGARVTAEADGELTVTARDPETEG